MLKDVLKTLAKFRGKHLRQSLFLSKVVGLKLATLLEKTSTQMFSRQLEKIIVTTF